MPLDLQAKLLRVLETGEFLKVGDSKPTKVNIRIIAATNRDLQKEVESGNFREDLYYRIAVLNIQIPPLRERIEDIEELANHFLKVFAHKTGKKIMGLSPDYISALKQHVWKGNIRELRNVIERSVILSDDQILDIDTLPVDIQYPKDHSKSLSAFSLSSVEKLHIQKVLNYTRGNKAEAARLLEIGITTLYRKLKEYGIN